MIRNIMLSAAFLGIYTYGSAIPDSKLIAIKVTPRLEFTVEVPSNITKGEEVIIIIRALKEKCAELAVKNEELTTKNNVLKELIEELQRNHFYECEELKQKLTSLQNDYEYVLQNVVDLQAENDELEEQLKK